MATEDVPITLSHNGEWAQTGPESWVRLDKLISIEIYHSGDRSTIRAALDNARNTTVVLGSYADRETAIEATNSALTF